MAKEIIIIGGFLDSPSRDAFVKLLSEQVSSDATWEWISCEPDRGFEAPRGLINRLSERLNKSRRNALVAPDNAPEIAIIKLFDIHARTENQLYRSWADPIIAPIEARNSTDFITWAKSPEANLFPRAEWNAGEVEAALVAILCKLLRNKSWNASVQGHAWTKEEDLLNQSPVARNDRPKVAIEARRLLANLKDGLLLTKGSGQGKTPKEWSINTKFLPEVKRAMIAHSLDKLAGLEFIAGILARIAAEVEKPYQLHAEIVTEKVLSVCRQKN